jgi:hypothetical protein
MIMSLLTDHGCDSQCVKQGSKRALLNRVSNSIYLIFILGFAAFTLTIGDSNELDRLCSRYSPPRACQQF